LTALDVTGVREADTHIGDMLLRAAQSVRLLGAQLVLTGVRAGVARVLVRLGVNLNEITTRRTLQDGIRWAEGLIDDGHSSGEVGVRPARRRQQLD
jgi:rsbT co-antagonist protein RsbR